MNFFENFPTKSKVFGVFDKKKQQKNLVILILYGVALFGGYFLKFLWKFEAKSPQISIPLGGNIKYPQNRTTLGLFLNFLFSLCS
jgi:hypothetical protein